MLDPKIVKSYRATAIFMLANNVHIDDVLEQMELHAENDFFAEAEGFKMGIHDWFAHKNELYCKTFPSEIQPYEQQLGLNNFNNDNDE